MFFRKWLSRDNILREFIFVVLGAIIGSIIGVGAPLYLESFHSAIIYPPTGYEIIQGGSDYPFDIIAIPIDIRNDHNHGIVIRDLQLYLIPIDLDKHAITLSMYGEGSELPKNLAELKQQKKHSIFIEKESVYSKYIFFSLGIPSIIDSDPVNFIWNSEDRLYRANFLFDSGGDAVTTKQLQIRTHKKTSIDNSRENCTFGSQIFEYPISVRESSDNEFFSEGSNIQNIPLSEEGWFYKGNALYADKKYEDALDAYNYALKIKPNYSIVWVNKAAIFNRIGQYEEALNASDMSLKIFPYDNLGWNNRGSALLNLGRYQEALDAFNQSLSLNSNFALTWANIGIVYSKLNQEQNAINAYKNALSIDPGLAITWNFLGITEGDRGNFQGALYAYDQALKIDPFLEEVYINKGVAYDNLYQYQDALDLFDKYLKINPKSDLVWSNKAEIYGKVGQYLVSSQL